MDPAEELIMVFPFFLSPDGDDAERRPCQEPDDDLEDEAERAGGADWISRLSADEWLVERTARALAGDPLVHGRRLEIEVQNAVVILLGKLASADAREAAGRRVWSVEGVRDVCNRLTMIEADAGGR